MAASITLSLFAAISAIALDEEGQPLDPSPVEDTAAGSSDSTGEIPGLVGEVAVEPDPSEADAPLPALVQPVPTPEPDPVSAATSPRTRKRELREKNSECVRNLVHRTQLGHANIHAELNQRVGIRRITEATADQLQRRLLAAQKWLKKL